MAYGNAKYVIKAETGNNKKENDDLYFVDMDLERQKYSLTKTKIFAKKFKTEDECFDIIDDLTMLANPDGNINTVFIIDEA